MAQVASASQLRLVQRLLWNTICHELKEAERDEVRSVAVCIACQAVVGSGERSRG